MTEVMRDEPSSRTVVDRATFQAELDALARRPTHGKATPLRPPAAGCL